MGWWLVSAGVAWSRSDDPNVACQDGVGRILFDAEFAETALLRGPNTSFLPAVAATVTTAAGDRPALVVVDLAGGCSRIDPATTRALGLSIPERGIVELPSLTVAGLHLTEVRARLDDDAPGLVLGVPSLGKVAAAVLPSTGRVVFADSAAGSSLLGRVGVAVAVPGRKGSPLQVPGAMRWGPVVVDGTFELRTDLRESRIRPSGRLPEPVTRGGFAAWDVGTRLGDVWLADTWIRRGEATPTALGDQVGALGYDVLFAVDLAVDPATRTVAFRAVQTDRSQDATTPAVDAATARYEAEEKAAADTANATAGPTDPRAVISFDGPVAAAVPLGDPGNALVRDRNLVLADTLWRAGRLEEALTYYSAAARYAGDHCGAHLDLAERRTAWAGTDRSYKDLVRKLIDDPLERAAGMWDTWSRLSDDVRDAVRAGTPPAGGVQVDQPASCALVFGWQHRLTSGPTDAFERAHDRDPGVAWSRLLRELELGRYGAADAILPLSAGAVPTLWRDLVELRLAAVLHQPARAETVWAGIPGAPTDTPLLSALLVYEAASTTNTPADWTRKLLRQDPRWVPGQLAHALASGEAPPPWDDAAAAREPGSPQVRCQRAVHQALSGDLASATRTLDLDRRPAEPDWWAAQAVVAHLRGERERRDQALEELKWRFPLLPVDRLGLRDPPAPPPPPPPTRKRR